MTTPITPASLPVSRTEVEEWAKERARKHFEETQNPTYCGRPACEACLPEVEGLAQLLLEAVAHGERLGLERAAKLVSGPVCESNGGAERGWRAACHSAASRIRALPLTTTEKE